MIKSKRPGGPLLSDLHFVTSLEPEACVTRLEGLRRTGVTLAVQEVEGPDAANFRLALWRDEGTVAEVRGTLRRWQGTRTRVDCSGMLAADQGVRAYLPALLLFIGILVAMSGALMQNPALLCLAAAAAVVFLPLERMGFNQSLYGMVREALGMNRRADEARMQTYREMDALLQEVSTALATADVEWVENTRSRTN